MEECGYSLQARNCGVQTLRGRRELALHKPVDRVAGNGDVQDWIVSPGLEGVVIQQFRADLTVKDFGVDLFIGRQIAGTKLLQALQLVLELFDSLREGGSRHVLKPPIVVMNSSDSC
jgi:hypothetical protein